MAFHPLKGGFDQSLLGVGANSEIVDPVKLVDRAHYLAKSDNGFNLSKTIIVIIISAVIFVTIVSMYDVLRNWINNYFAKIALTDSKAQNTEQEIASTIIANKEGLKSSIVFSVVCIILAITIIYFFLKYVQRIT